MIIYIRVEIKTEQDLPQEGTYFCNRSGFETVQKLIPVLKKTYMREIRWYLKPINIEDADLLEKLKSKL